MSERLTEQQLEELALLINTCRPPVAELHALLAEVKESQLNLEFFAKQLREAACNRMQLEDEVRALREENAKLRGEKVGAK